MIEFVGNEDVERERERESDRFWQQVKCRKEKRLTVMFHTAEHLLLRIDDDQCRMRCLGYGTACVDNTNIATAMIIVENISKV